MSNPKGSISPFPKPDPSRRLQSHLDWNTTRTPAETPRLEWMTATSRFPAALLQNGVGRYEPGSNGAVLQ
ncbi:MAG: hypothetical protein ACLGSD_13820 [Acidobacteriota bacterium]